MDTLRQAGLVAPSLVYVWFILASVKAYGASTNYNVFLFILRLVIGIVLTVFVCYLIISEHYQFSGWLFYVGYYLFIALLTIRRLAQNKQLRLSRYNQQLDILFFRSAFKEQSTSFTTKHKFAAINIVVGIVLLLAAISFVSEVSGTCSWPDTFFGGSGCFKEIATNEGFFSDYFVDNLSFSPDGAVLAMSYSSGGLDGKLRLIDVQSGATIRELTGQRNYITSLAFSPDGKLLASGSEDKTVNLWQVSDGHLLQMFNTDTNDNITATFSPDGTLIAVGASSDNVRIWRVADGTLVRELPGTSAKMAFSPDGKIIATREDETYGSVSSAQVLLWRVSDGTLLDRLVGPKYAPEELAFSPNGVMLAIGGVSDVRLWRVADGQLIQVLEKFSNDNYTTLTNMIFSSDNQTLYASQNIFDSHADEFPLLAWNVVTGKKLSVTTITSSSTTAFSQATNVLASATLDDKIRYWHLKV